MTYIDDLKHPKWQKKRLKIFERDKWACQFCRSRVKQLHIHHKKYLKGKKPWEYPNKLLITLCWMCHEDLSNKTKLNNQLSLLESKIANRFNRKLSRQIDLVISLLEGKP